MLFEAVEKRAAVGTLGFVVGVDCRFKQPNDPEPLPLGSDRTKLSTVALC